MVRIIINLLSTILYCGVIFVYAVAWFIVRRIFGVKVRFDTTSFDALFDAFDK